MRISAFGEGFKHVCVCVFVCHTWQFIFSQMFGALFSSFTFSQSIELKWISVQIMSHRKSSIAKRRKFFFLRLNLKLFLQCFINGGGRHHSFIKNKIK
jgi:hypothetical protein